MFKISLDTKTTFWGFIHFITKCTEILFKLELWQNSIQYFWMSDHLWIYWIRVEDPDFLLEIPLNPICQIQVPESGFRFEISYEPQCFCLNSCNLLTSDSVNIYLLTILSIFYDCQSSINCFMTFLEHFWIILFKSILKNSN